MPFVQTVFPLVPNLVPPLDERRRPSPFPDWGLLSKVDGEFATQLNAWFDDRIGFRDLFIRTKNQIDYSVFATSRKVYFGRDGWLFEREPPDPLGKLTPAQLATLEQSFVSLADLLAKRGIRLVVVGHPHKMRVYPEMAAPEQPVAQPNDNVDKLRQFLANQPSIIYVDAATIYKKTKTETNVPLYSKTDFHPNEVGQLAVVKEIIARIAEAEGRKDVRWHEDLELTHVEGGAGYEGRLLATLSPISEKEYYYHKGHFLVGGEEADGKWTIPDPKVLTVADDGVGRPYDFEFRSNPDLCPQRLPGMVIFGNSFSDFYWSVGLHRYFCFSRRARHPINRLKLFIDTIPEGTKYFILQYVDTWLVSEGLPKVELQ